jgi:hypothetical protein
LTTDPIDADEPDTIEELIDHAPHSFRIVRGQDSFQPRDGD